MRKSEILEKLDGGKKIQANRKVTESAYCDACNKKFSNKTTYRNHLKSKKHKKNEESMKKKEETIGENEVETVEFDPEKNSYRNQNICLFSNKESNSVEE